jgi:hypothetical protein
MTDTTVTEPAEDRWHLEEFYPDVDSAPPELHPDDEGFEDGAGLCTGEDDGEGMDGVALPEDAQGLLRGLPEPRDPDTIVPDREDPRMADTEGEA